MKASAFRVLGDADRAEDAAHDVFVRLLSDPTRFDPSRGELGPYLSLMGRSRALDLWRSDQAGTRAAERLRGRVAEAGQAAAPERPDELTQRGAERAALTRALHRLPTAQREAVVLAHWGGMSAKEIAQRSGAPVATVKSRLRLGLNKLATEADDGLSVTG